MEHTKYLKLTCTGPKARFPVIVMNPVPTKKRLLGFAPHQVLLYHL